MQKKGTVGIYKVKSGGYQTSILDSKGKRVRTRFLSYREAKVHKQKLQSCAGGYSALNEGQAIANLIQDFIKSHPETNIAKRSPYAFKMFVERFGAMPIHDLHKIHLMQWLDEIKESKGYGSRTMLQCRYAFTPFFRDLVDRGFLIKNLLAEVKIKRGARMRERVFLSESELRQILDGLKAVSPEHTFPVIYFLLHTGCKIREAISLRQTQLDLEKRSVHFPATPTAAAREIRLSQPILEFLKAKPSQPEFVFFDDRGRPWTQSYYGKCIAKDRARLAQPRHWDSFSFRHSFAYHFLRKGGTLQQLQVVLGHRNIGDTIEAYGSIISRADQKLSPYEN